jgi:hypothetical protein
MHGTELCVLECGALLPLRSTRGVFFLRHQLQRFLARRSLSPKQDRSLVAAFRSPRTVPAFTGSIPGSKFLACSFASRTTARKLVRLPAPLPAAVRPAAGRFLASARRLLAAAPDQPLLTASTPLRGFYTPLDQSVLPEPMPINPPSGCARFLFAPRSRLSIASL